MLFLSLASLMAVLEAALGSPTADSEAPRIQALGMSAPHVREGLAAGDADPGMSAERERRAAWAAQLRLQVLVTACACLVIGSLLAWLAGSWLAGSLQGLAEALQRVADGEDSQALPRRGPREVVTVIMALDSTVVVLGEHRRQLAECMLNHAAAAQRLHAASRTLVTTSTHSRGRTELALLATRKISSQEHALTQALAEMAATTLAVQQHAQSTLQATHRSREQMRALVSMVQTLARESATAADDAHRRLRSFQDGIAGIIDESQHLSTMIETIVTVQGALATDIEQQAAAASGIRGLFTATMQTNQALAAGLQGVAESTQTASVQAEQINHLAQGLADLSYELGPLIGNLPVPQSSGSALHAYDRRLASAKAAREAQRQSELF